MQKMKLEEFKLITAKEVAEHLKISELTVRLYRKTKRIPAKKVGNQYLFLEKEVINFILNAN